MDPGIGPRPLRASWPAPGQRQNVVTAVGGRDVIVKKITMDRKKEPRPRGHPLGSEAACPFDMDNVELDFQILDPDGEGPNDGTLWRQA